MSSVFLRLRSKRYSMRAAARLRLPRETKLYRQSNVFFIVDVGISFLLCYNQIKYC